MGKSGLTLALVALATTLAAGGQPGPRRVLFVGNSFTYYNNLPCLVAKLAESRSRRIETAMIVEGGAALGDHWQKPATRAAVAGAWDAVVLQTQSTFGRTVLVDGVDRIGDTASLADDVAPYANAIAAPGRLVLYEHWKRQAAPARDQLAIHAAFAGAARQAAGRVIPAGLAWELAAQDADPPSLYDADGAHPSPAGSYLAALTAYAVLTGDTPEGLPSSVTCPEIDQTTEKETSTKVTLRIEAQTAARLQRAAARAVREWKDLRVGTVPPIEPPSISPSAGEPLGATELSGTWSGTTNLYPRSLPWPASMSLAFQSPTAARLTISFGGRPDEIVRDVTVTTNGRVLRFEDVEGPNGTTVVYRGVLRGGVLTGLAEFRGNPGIEGFASWTLRRQ